MKIHCHLKEIEAFTHEHPQITIQFDEHREIKKLHTNKCPTCQFPSFLTGKSQKHVYFLLPSRLAMARISQQTIDFIRKGNFISHDSLMLAGLHTLEGVTEDSNLIMDILRCTHLHNYQQWVQSFKSCSNSTSALCMVVGSRQGVCRTEYSLGQLM